MKVKVQMTLGLAYDNIVVQHVSHYASKTSYFRSCENIEYFKFENKIELIFAFVHHLNDISIILFSQNFGNFTDFNSILGT